MKRLKSISIVSIIYVSAFFLSTGNHLYAQSKGQYSISDYGAVGNGTTLNTKAIQSVIDKASAHGGGMVIIPGGRFLTGMLVMKSNVNLHLEKDAVLLGSADPFDYPAVDMPALPESPKKDDNSPLALLVAYRADNISVTGSGTIDGQGTQLALNIDSLIHLGIIKDPRYSNRPNEKVRPKLFLFALCKNVHIEDATLKNPACWGLSFELCDHLTLNNLHVINRAYWNNDGTDITDCRNVRITNCDINSADDGICLKSYYPGYCDDSFYISNCTIRSGASAVKFGTASFGGFKNITIDNIKVFDTYRSALAIESVDGGDVENIRATNIVAKNTGNAIFIRLGNRIRKEPGQIKNVYIGNISVQIPFGRPDINYDLRAAEPAYHNPFASSITGIPGYDVKNITLENIDITYPGRASKAQAYFPLWRLKDFPERAGNYPEFSMFGEMPAWGFYIRHAENITMKNIRLRLDKDDFRPAFVLDDVKGIELDKVTLPPAHQNDEIIVRDCREIRLKESEEINIRKIQ